VLEVPAGRSLHRGPRGLACLPESVRGIGAPE
jgi:hypothetical protein